MKKRYVMMITYRAIAKL